MMSPKHPVRAPGPSRARGARRTTAFLTALLGAAGVAHFVKPEPFDSIVPPALPGSPRIYTLASGAAELATAALLAAPRTRALGGSAAIALFIAVFPANLQMAWDARHRHGALRTIVLTRLPLQAVLIAQAEHVRRSAR